MKKIQIPTIEVDRVDFGLYDIDGRDNTNSSDVQEKVILYSDGDYTLTTNPATSLTVKVNNDSVEFLSPATSITNPSGASTLDPDLSQPQHSVNFVFNNVSEFQIGYQVIGGNNGRNFFFGGDLVFNADTETLSFEVPFEFSPSLGLLLSGGSLLGIEYLKRKRAMSKSNDN